MSLMSDTMDEIFNSEKFSSSFLGEEYSGSTCMRRDRNGNLLTIAGAP